tara:strand:- start:246 stop:476 length:231 start_codon:yes stop_codon:yes gene_type:complete
MANKTKDMKAARKAFYDSKGTDYSAQMSFEEFLSNVWPSMNRAAGGVSLDFEEANVRDSMFTGGAAIRGRNFSGNY